MYTYLENTENIVKAPMSSHPIPSPSKMNSFLKVPEIMCSISICYVEKIPIMQGPPPLYQPSHVVEQTVYKPGAYFAGNTVFGSTQHFFQDWLAPSLQKNTLGMCGYLSSINDDDFTTPAGLPMMDTNIGNAQAYYDLWDYRSWLGWKLRQDPKILYIFPMYVTTGPGFHRLREDICCRVGNAKIVPYFLQ